MSMGPMAGATQTNPLAMMGGQAPDNKKLFIAERENLELVEHLWVMEGSEDRLLAKYNKTWDA